MHFLLGLGLLGQQMVAVSLLLWVLAAGLLAARAVRIGLGGSAPWPLIGATAFWITPAVWDLLLLRKDDPSAIWGGAAMLVLLLGLSKSETLGRSEWITVALAAAATFSAKPGATAGYVLALLVFSWLAWPGPWRRRLVVLTAIAALFVVALLPIAIHTWLGLGHPLATVMPHLSHYELASTRWAKAIEDAYPFHAQPLSRMLPYALLELSRFYDPGRWNFGDNRGLLVLFLLPVALLASRERRWVLIWVVGIVGWFFTFHWPRFALVLLPLEILLIVALLSRLVDLRRAAALIAVLAVLHGGFYAVLTVTGSRIFTPAVAAVFGGSERLNFVPPSVSICEEANARLSAADDRILFIGETRCYPCRIPFDFWNAHFRHPFERVEHGVPPEESWNRHVVERGITHVIYSPQVARKHMEWSPEMHARFESWLVRHSAGKPLAAGDHESTTFLYALSSSTASAAMKAAPDDRDQ